MTERLHPGVYVEEVKPAVLAIEGVSTSTAAFVGVSERGPVNRARLVTSFAEYQRLFGGFRPDSFLTYSVQNFFGNGGNKCYIVRVVGTNSSTADIVLNDQERVGFAGPTSEDILAEVLPAAVAEPVLTIKAPSPGRWGNLVDVDVQNGTRDPTNELKLVISFREEVVETWDNLGMVRGDENYVGDMLGGDRSQYIQVQRLESATSDTPGVLLSGELDAAAQDLAAAPNNTFMAITLGVGEGAAETLTTVGKVALNRTNPAKNNGTRIAAEIQRAVRAAVPAGASAEVQRAFRSFRCEFVPRTAEGRPARYVLINGSDSNPSTVAVPAVTGLAATGETDVRDLLKLSVAAAGTDRATAIPGRTLQRGTSRSANEPATATDGGGQLSFNLNRDGFQTVDVGGVTGGDAVAAEIQSQVRAMAPQRRDPANQNAYGQFAATYESRYELIFGNVANAAGDFTFIASPDAAKDWSTDARLRLRATTAGTETLYGGATTGPLAMRPGLSERERTIISGSTSGTRPLADLSAISDGQLRLQIDPPGAAAAFSVDLALPAGAGPGTGDAIAQAIQTAVRNAANDPAIAAAAGLTQQMRDAIRAALTDFSARYVAAYTLTSGDVRTIDAAGLVVGPISSVEVLPGVNAATDLAPALKLGAVNLGVEQNGAALLRPTTGEYHLGDNTPGGAVFDVHPGADGNTPSDAAYVGDGVSTGLNALDKITDVSLIAIPGIGSKQVVAGGFGYCANRPLLDCFFIADLGGAPESDAVMFRASVPFATQPTDARDYVRGLPTKNDYGAIYFPWLVAPDPIGRGKNPTRYLPPSGYVAGMYSRIDNRRGVFKAPAGTESNLGNVLDLAARIDDVQQDLLNPLGINVIRGFPASGIVIWGARTLGADSSYRYVPVRRTAIFLRVSIYNGIQYAVFEPNDEDLWASLRLTIGGFMLTQFRAGAFQGNDPKKAFFVKCDATTTTQEDIDNGVVNILVGFAPLKPAEFVVLKLSQIAGQAA